MLFRKWIRTCALDFKRDRWVRDTFFSKQPIIETMQIYLNALNVSLRSFSLRSQGLASAAAGN